MKNISSAKFICSNTDVEKCPAPSFPEYAFCGRSNVGKSSLINMLAGVHGLAKTSSAPGKTRLINHFMLNDSFYVADLPGYGFARISKESKADWTNMINNYLLRRPNLMCLFALIDCRLEPQANDLGFLSFLGKHEIPFVIVFTKTDKLTTNQLQSKVELYKKELLKTWEELPKVFLTSSDKNKGRSEILDFIQESNTLFKKDFSIPKS